MNNKKNSIYKLCLLYTFVGFSQLTEADIAK